MWDGSKRMQTLSQSKHGSIWDRSKLKVIWMRTEIGLNESEIDLNECEHFLKANWDRPEIDPNWIHLIVWIAGLKQTFPDSKVIRIQFSTDSTRSYLYLQHKSILSPYFNFFPFTQSDIVRTAIIPKNPTNDILNFKSKFVNRINVA